MGPIFIKSVASRIFQIIVEKKKQLWIIIVLTEVTIF